VVLETAPLNAGEISEYCRAKGFYPEQAGRSARAVLCPTLLLRNLSEMSGKKALPALHGCYVEERKDYYTRPY
jgi:hypothetical protein